MSPLSRFALVPLLAAVSIVAAGAAAAELPAVARPGLARAGTSAAEGRGLVFFLASDGAAGVVAVGTAHTFPLSRIIEAGQVDFFLGHSMTRAASSTRFLVPPGRPFSLPGATLDGDYMVFALDAKPRGARVLEPERQWHPAPETRVRLLGVPVRGDRDEEGLYGRVVRVTPDRLEVELDVPQELRGWGGAPILLERSGRVVGLLQAHVPRGATTRVIGAPLQAALDAMASPLEGGSGRAFGAFAAAAASQPKPPAAPQKPSAARRRAPKEKILRQTEPSATKIHLEIEYPADGATVADSTCGVFVAGRAMALHGNVRRFDVAMVLDTSRSTIEPAGTDINGNGVVGQPRLGRLGSLFGSGSTDPGDSILAAEVAAARQLLRGLDPRSTRVALVTFAGDPAASAGWWQRGRPAAYTLEPLTRDYPRIQRSLDYILAQEPEGSTHMAAGVDQATIELMGLSGAYSKPDKESEKVVFFFTDGQPTLPYPDAEADNVRAVLRAANRAGRGNIKIHSFAIGPDALEGPIAVVEMASRTHGFFTPVRHPGDLVDVVEEVSFADLDEVVLKSETTGEVARPFRSTADGAWAGLVHMKAGKNRLRVHAVAEDGSRAEQTLVLNFVPTAPEPTIPGDLVVQRNRLLEDCLREAKQLRLDAEAQRAEQVRQELKLEIERERAKARARADEQRKQLQLEGEDDDGGDEN